VKVVKSAKKMLYRVNQNNCHYVHALKYKLAIHLYNCHM